MRIQLLPALALALLAIAPGALTGCAGRRAATETPAGEGEAESEAEAEVDLEEHALYTVSGVPEDFTNYVQTLGNVDLIAFGELHYHAVGSRYQLELLEGLATQSRPIALAMEFFEADHQAALDEYLAGAIDEAAFRERTKRDEHYDDSHRPLIEFCKANKIPVIAANAPRPLVTGYRKSGLSYPAYLASLTPEERALMPMSSEPRDDEFKARFMELMGPERGPAFFKSMALWNDAMAESIARFRTKNPEHRVMLVVGVFHVAARLGLIEEFRNRRPSDVTSVLTMIAAEDGPMGFAEENLGEGDVILKVRVPPARGGHP